MTNLKGFAMLHLVAWTIVVGLAVIWSVACWGLGTFGVWALSNANQLSGVASGVGQGPIPSWLLPWMPEAFAEALRPILAETATLIARLLQMVPGLSDGFSVAVWVIWALGAGLLVLLGVASSVAAAWWGRRSLRRGSEPGVASRAH